MPFGIGPLELIIVLVIVLVIFGPKRLPGLGRSLGSGMREFKDSIAGKDERRGARTTRPPSREGIEPSAKPAAAKDGRGRRRGGAGLRRAPQLAGPPTRDGHRDPADRPRGPALPRRAPRRAAHAAHHLRARAVRRVRGLRCGRTTRCCGSSTSRSKETTKSAAKNAQGPARSAGALRPQAARGAAAQPAGVRRCCRQSRAALSPARARGPARPPRRRSGSARRRRRRRSRGASR